MKRLPSLLAAALVLVALAAVSGCKTPPTVAPDIAAPPPPPPPPPEPPAEIPVHRRPSLHGDVLVYPVQWRNAEELRARLYEILQPKYGNDLTITADPTNNALLIYLPRGRRAAQSGGVEEPGRF